MNDALNIIIAEDNIEIQSFIKEALQEAEVNVTATVDNNEDFQTALNENPYSVVISDFFLKDHKSVFDFALKDFSEHEKFKFIFITGYDDDATYKSCLEFNPVSFLSKPFTKQSINFALDQAKKLGFETQNYLDDFSSYLHHKDLSSQDLSAQVGEYLKSIRSEFNITQQEFSQKVGVSLRQIQRIEGGDNTSIDKLTAVLKGIQQIKTKQ